MVKRAQKKLDESLLNDRVKLFSAMVRTIIAFLKTTDINEMDVGIVAELKALLDEAGELISRRTKIDELDQRIKVYEELLKQQQSQQWNPAPWSSNPIWRTASGTVSTIQTDGSLGYPMVGLPQGPVISNSSVNDNYISGMSHGEPINK